MKRSVIPFALSAVVVAAVAGSVGAVGHSRDSIRFDRHADLLKFPDERSHG